LRLEPARLDHGAWTGDEVEAVLGGAAANPGPQAGDPGLPALFASAYGVTATGNWTSAESRTFLCRPPTTSTLRSCGRSMPL
jgi:hypothetical protein